MGIRATCIGPLPNTASSWVVADIPRMAARGMLLVRSWRGYISAPRFQADRLARPTQRPPQRISGLLHLPCAPALACFPCEFVVGCRQWLPGCTSASFIALMVWASFKHAPSSALSSSSLQKESIVALVVSNCSRALFILYCIWRSSPVSLASLTLGGVWCCEIKEMPTTSGVFGMVGWSKGWATWGMAEPISFSLRRSSVSSVEGGAPKTTEGGSFLGIVCWETRVGAVEEVHCSHFKTLWRWWFMAMAMSQGGSIVLAGEWASAGIVVGAWMVVVPLSGCAWPRSTLEIMVPWRAHQEQQHPRGVAQRGWSVGPLGAHLSPLDTLPALHAATTWNLQLAEPAISVSAGHAIHHGVDMPFLW